MSVSQRYKRLDDTTANSGNTPTLTVKRSNDDRYKLLTPPSNIDAVAGDKLNSAITKSCGDFLNFIKQIPEGSVVAFDTETTGTKIFNDPDFCMVGMSICYGYDAHYIDTKEFTKYQIIRLLRELRNISLSKNLRLICHNLFFDASVVAFYLGDTKLGSVGWLPYHACTYGLFHYLASEGFEGQSWSLETAQLIFLLWDKSNKDLVSDWLIEHGYKNNKGAADKSQMWRVPSDILGYYCNLDTYSTLMFYEHVLIPSMDKYTDREFFDWFHTEVFLLEVRNCVSAYRRGISLDIEGLHRFRESTEREVELAMGRIYKKYRREISAINKKFLDSYPKPGGLPNEPEILPPKNTHKKDGSATTAYLKYRLKVRARAARIADTRREMNSREMVKFGRRKQTKKAHKYKGLVRSDMPDYLRQNMFNLNSTKQKREFLYEQLNTKYEEIEDGFRAGRAITLKPSEIVLDKTDSRELPTGKAAMAAILGFGNLIDKYNAEVKKLQFTNSAIDKYNPITQRIHLPVKIPGTVTLRLGGDGGFNIQNPVKSQDFLKNFESSSGNLLFQLDLCLHPDMEILTKRGWISAISILSTDIVWQVDPISLQGSWIVPTRIVKRYYEGDMHVIKNARGEIAATTGHDMLYLGQHHATRKDKEKLRYYKKIEEDLPSSVCCLATSTTSADLVDINENEITHHDIWMACMLQADGTCIRDGVYSIEVAKPRKREKVKLLLNGKSGTVTQRTQNGKIKLESETWRVYWKHPLLNKKTINIDLLTNTHIATFIEALSFWDGHVDKAGTVCYTSCDKLQIDMIQSWLVRHGYECKQSMHPSSGNVKHRQAYILRIRNSDRIRIRHVDKSVYHYAGMVGCVTVPSGFILIRGGGQSLVVGNCAVEPTVFAELSRDESMLKLYGPDAKPNDVYIFVAAKIGGQLGQPFLDLGYDPDNPTKEAISLCKTKLKKLRNAAKSLTLSDDYGSKAFKKWQTLRIGGFDYTLDDVKEMQDGLDKVFKGKRKFAETLHNEWSINDGWVYDAFGMPVAIDESKIKDAPNRCIQRSGHLILMLFIYKISWLLYERNIPYDWFIVDFHDETIIEAGPKYASEIKTIFKEALVWVNEEILQPYIPIKGEPQVAGNLAEIKVEKYRNEDDELADLIDELNG